MIALAPDTTAPARAPAEADVELCLDGVLGVADAAAFLGLSPQKLRALIEAGTIRASRLPSEGTRAMVRVPKRELARYAAAHLTAAR